nr:MAG TPA: hypothetical protein [Caudoviricetes sp.]
MTRPLPNRYQNWPTLAQFGPVWPSLAQNWARTFRWNDAEKSGWPSLAQNWARSWARTFRWNDAEKSGSWPSFEELPYIVREF